MPHQKTQRTSKEIAAESPWIQENEGPLPEVTLHEKVDNGTPMVSFVLRNFYVGLSNVLGRFLELRDIFSKSETSNFQSLMCG